MDKNTFLDFAKSFWLVISTIFVAFVLIFIFWFLIVKAQTDYLQKNEEYNVLASKRVGTIQINRDRGDLEALSQKLNDSFIDKDKFVKFIEFIEATAKDTGNSIDLSNISEKNNIQNFKIILGGSYPAEANFIAQLENSPYLVRLTNINMNKTFDSVSKTGYLKTTLDIQVQLP